MSGVRRAVGKRCLVTHLIFLSAPHIAPHCSGNLVQNVALKPESWWSEETSGPTVKVRLSARI